MSREQPPQRETNKQSNARIILLELIVVTVVRLGFADNYNLGVFLALVGALVFGRVHACKSRRECRRGRLCGVGHIGGRGRDARHA